MHKYIMVNPNSALPTPSASPNKNSSKSRSRSYSPTAEINVAGKMNVARRTSSKLRRDSSYSPVVKTTLRRAKTEDSCTASPIRSRPNSMRRNQSTGTDNNNVGSVSPRSSLLQDYRVGHAKNVHSSPIARRVSAPTAESARSPTNNPVFDLPARKYPKAKPTPGMALDMSLLSDTSASDNTTEMDVSVEELIQFQLKNPNSIPTAPPPPKPVLPQSQLMMGKNHRALHSIEEAAGSEHSAANKSIQPASSQHNHKQDNDGLLETRPDGLDDSAHSFEDDTSNRPSVIASRFSDVSAISSRCSELSMTEATQSLRLSEIFAFSIGSSITEATDEQTSNNLFNLRSSAASRDSASLPPLEQMPEGESIAMIGTITAKEGASPQSPTRTSSGGSTQEEAQQVHASIANAAAACANATQTTTSKVSAAQQQPDLTTKSSNPLKHPTARLLEAAQQEKASKPHKHPTARLLEAAAKAVQDPPPSKRHPRRNTLDVKKDDNNSKALPGLRRTQTSTDASRSRDQSMEEGGIIRGSMADGSGRVRGCSMDGSGRARGSMADGSGRVRGCRSSEQLRSSDNSLPDGRMDSSGNKHNTSPSSPRRGRGAIRRTKSSDGTSGMGRMRRGRRGEAGGEETGDSNGKRAIPARTRSSDGGIMAARDRRGGLRASAGSNPDTKKNGFRRSRSTVTSAEADKDHNKPTRSVSPIRRANANKDSGFGASHPVAMFNSSRIKRFNKEDVGDTNFGGQEFSKLMLSHSGGLNNSFKA